MLRELVPWRDGIAGQLDRATFRVVGNEQLLEIAKQQPASRDTLGAIKGMPRGILESRGERAARRGEARARRVRGRSAALSESAAMGSRSRISTRGSMRSRRLRDAAATRLDLDPGVLCSRDRHGSRRAQESVEPRGAGERSRVAPLAGARARRGVRQSARAASEDCDAVQCLAVSRLELRHSELAFVSQSRSQPSEARI